MKMFFCPIDQIRDPCSTEHDARTYDYSKYTAFSVRNQSSDDMMPRDEQSCVLVKYKADAMARGSEYPLCRFCYETETYKNNVFKDLNKNIGGDGDVGITHIQSTFWRSGLRKM
jgi:hypothetical protein